ncbi:golgin IMH1-like [Nicotiana sylvestris]|uniref:golgin IMH1-like n=1 Tax=Nicotiana sylvestris TaxID=4096 RepID=UPI00388CAE89
MRRVTIEVPADSSLLRKSVQANVWLEPLIGPIEKAKLESHSSLTLMNDIANLIGTEMISTIPLLEKVARDSQLEAINWKEQFESAKIDMEDLEEGKSTLEQQVRALTSELAVAKASSSQAEKDKEYLESFISDQLSKASKENRELKALLSQKEVYVGELVQSLTQAQEDLRVSADKVRALERSHASLQASYNSTFAENEELKNEIADWEKDYETLEEKSVVEQTQEFPSPVVEAPVNVEADTGIPTLSSPTESIAASQVETASVDAPAQIEPTAIDAPALVPQTSQ